MRDAVVIILALVLLFVCLWLVGMMFQEDAENRRRMRR